jgi:hypothetical protein
MSKPTPEQTAARADLLVTFDAHECHPAPSVYDEMRAGLGGLARQVAHFPTHDLRVYIEGKARSNEFVVKLSLILPGRTFACSERGPTMYGPFERCVDVLVEQVKAYKDSLGQVPERQKAEKGTHQPLLPTTPIDIAAVSAAVEAGDYAAFRTALAPYEDGLRVRVGRWIERYPAVQGLIGKRLEAVDVAEAVFLAAFDEYDHQPLDERFGDWLESLIDPTVRAFEHNPDEELENVNMARTAVDAGPA